MNAIKSPVDFSDLDDLDSAEVVGNDKAATMLEAGAEWAARQGDVQQRVKKLGRRDVPRDPLKFAPCSKCRGTGRYTGYGFQGNRCFPCNGTGNGLSIEPKAVQARVRAADRKLSKAQQLVNAVVAFRAANPDIVAWWNANPNFEFASSTHSALVKFGSLTENQVNAIRKCIANQAARDAARAQERAARAVDMGGEGFVRVLEHFAKAQASGLRNPALVFEGLCFKPAKKYPGSLYITGGKAYESEFYGRVDASGKFDPTRAVTPEKLAAIKAIGADPVAAAIAYGQATGCCACCGAELTNKVSIEYGIGPICRERWGM